MKPSIQSVSPAAVGAAGGELVQITGAGIGPRVAVLFGARPAEVLAILSTGDVVAVDVRVPASEAGAVSILLQNVASDGSPIAGETASAPFRFLRALLGVESDLTRLVRVLLRALKSQVIAN